MPKSVMVTALSRLHIRDELRNFSEIGSVLITGITILKMNLPWILDTENFMLVQEPF